MIKLIDPKTAIVVSDFLDSVGNKSSRISRECIRNGLGGLQLFAGQPNLRFPTQFCVLEFSVRTSSYSLSADADAKCELSLRFPAVGNFETHGAFLPLHKSYYDQSIGPWCFLPWWMNHLWIKFSFFKTLLLGELLAFYSYPCPLATPTLPLLIP